MISINRKAVRAAGGTQSDELQAKIKSVTSSTTVGAVFVYDTRSDSDGGAWRKKCAGLSWFDEDLNTATRGGRREFPSVALIVSDSASGVTIYDLDDPAMPMWMVFNSAYADRSTKMLWHNTSGGLFALNGRIWLGRTWVNFAKDSGGYYQSDDNFIYTGGIADRHSTTAISSGSERLASNTVNDVAATIVEGSELGALGLPIPTIACATAGGISVILANKTVSNSSSTSARYKVAFDADKRLWAANANNGSLTHIQFTDLGEWFTGSWGATLFSEKDHSSASSYSPNYLGSDAEVAIGSGREVFAGTDEGLSVFQFNRGNPSESAVAYITSNYNTGYMLGDIRLATFAASSFKDRSVRANTLTKNGTINGELVATNAEVYGYSNFSASNYLSSAYDADFDFGTGDFSIMFWVKFSENSVYDGLLSREYHNGSAYSGNGFEVETGGNNSIILKDSSGASLSSITGDSVFGQWRQIIFTRRSGNLYAYRDGVLMDGPDANTTNFDNSNATLEIGKRVGSTSTVADKSSLTLLRISATAPTPQQVKEMYEAEAPLFRAGAKCLLSQISFNNVNDLAYDNSSDLLYVGSLSGDAGDSVSTFRGLERVDTKDGQDLGWDGASAHLVAAAGGVVGYARTSGTGGVIVDLPAIDVRGDINTADSKLPDDGKIRFSGVTTDATPTVIGQIPVANNEHITVSAQVCSKVYNFDSVNSYYEKLVASFQKKPDGTFALSSGFSNPTQSVSDTSGLASVDVEIVHSSSAGTVQIKVTGNASYRMQWDATVEVQRISEKTYER